MKLVIREYLNMMKESDELDALISDLLLEMNINVLSKPQKGVRQYGVDISGVGIDELDGTEKVFLITVKRGDVNRKSWNAGNEQDLRPSLEDILDNYLRINVAPEHRNLPKKIIAAAGGDLKQNAQTHWNSFVSNKTGQDHYGSNIEFDFWGADKLALLIEKHFMDEHLFPESAKSKIRKTIAMADEMVDEPKSFYELVEEMLSEENFPLGNSSSDKTRRQKILRRLNLSLSVIHLWCKECKNLKPAFLSSERSVLRTWDKIRQSNLVNCQKTINVFHSIFESYLKIASDFVNKLQPHCFVKDGLFGYGGDELEYPFRTFELIGILGSLGMGYSYMASLFESKESKNEISQRLLEQAQNIGFILANLIDNNPSSRTPLYDNHSIDIVNGLLLLMFTNHSEQAQKWIEQLCSSILFAFRIGKSYPISYDSYEELVNVLTDQAESKEKLTEISTLIPILADWHVIFDLNEEYDDFQREFNETFSHTSFQRWFPDSETEDTLYQKFAGRTGHCYPFRNLPQTIKDLKNEVSKLHKERDEYKSLSCFLNGWPGIGLMASRHFRTPVIPAYWFYGIVQLDESPKGND